MGLQTSNSISDYKLELLCTVSIANLAKIQSWFWLLTPNVFLHAEATPGDMGSYIVKEGGGGGRKEAFLLTVGYIDFLDFVRLKILLPDQLFNILGYLLPKIFFFIFFYLYVLLIFMIDIDIVNHS